MSFSFDKFLRPLTSTDRNIKIYEDNGILKYTINPFHIKNVNVLNNTMRINLDSDRSIVMVFSTSNESKISLSKLQGQMDVLTEKVPFMIDKDILNYVTANIKIGPTGSNGTSGLSKIYTGTSSNFLTIPAYGSLVQLYTQTDLGFVPGQTIVVYKDFPANYYVAEDYYADSDPVYMIGDIDTYNPSTGQLAFIANICQPTGATSSFWYINLTGQRGKDGTSGTSGTSGHDGLSAFEVWVADGSPNYGGVLGEEKYGDFLDAIRGGAGPAGAPGFDGAPGLEGPIGPMGPTGANGLSAFEIWIADGSPNYGGVLGEETPNDFLDAIRGGAGPAGPPGSDGAPGPKGATGSSFDIGFGNGLLLVGNTMSIGGTLYETLGMNGANNDLIATGFDNISMTSSVFDVVSNLISLDSDDTQILAINDITISAAGQLALTGDSGLVVIGNTQGLVYQSDYSTGFVDNSLVSKKYVDDNIPSGATGPTGSAGTSGTSGTNGTGFIWRGEWNPSGSYISDVDVVSDAGGTYIKISDNGNSGSSPSNDAVRWGLVAQPGTSGTSGESGTPGTNGINGVDGAASLRWELKNNLAAYPGVGDPEPGLFTVGITAYMDSTTLYRFAYNSLSVVSEGFFDTIGNAILIGNSVYLQVTRVLNTNYTSLHKVTNIGWNGTTSAYEITVDAPAVYANPSNSWVQGSEYSVSFSIVGANGTSGTSGINGTNGTSGTTGTSGTSGTSGITPTTDWTLSGSLTVSGTSSLSGHTILSEISETINVTPGATASTVVYDFSTGAIWYHATASTNFTANFTNMPIDNNRVITATIMISQGATPYIPTAVQIGGTASVIKWAGGTASGTANKLDIVGFTFVRADSVWAQVLGQISYFG